MSRSPLTRYGVPVVTVALALPLLLLLSPRGMGAVPLLLAAVTVSASHGGLGPGLLATASSALALDLLLPPRYSPGAGWAAGVRLTLFLLVAVLISELYARHRRLGEALRRQDRSKDELLATLAHELRTPVSTTLNALHILRLAGAESEDGLRARAVVERQARAIARLAEDLLDVSRIGLGKLRLDKTVVDVAVPVAEAIETVRPLLDSRRHQLEVALPLRPVVLEVDPTRLRQVVVNLLTNAANYTEPGGRVRLGVERGEAEVILRVSDTGVGLPPEVLPRVFDLFVQAEDGSRGGLGLGLNLVRNLVEMHGGRVDVFSAGAGRGSEFVVRIPFSGAGQAHADSAPEGRAPFLGQELTARRL